MPQIVIQFLLFGLAFVILPFGASYFETPKVVIAEMIILFLAGYVLLSKTTFRIQWDYLLLLLGLFFLSIFHLAFGMHPNTFWGNAFRGQGVLLLWTLLLFSFLSSRIVMRPLPRFIIPLLLFIQLVASIFLDTKDGRAIGTLGEPNALAAFAVFVWPFVLIADKKKGERDNAKEYFWILLSLSIILSAVIIIFSGSRSGFTALGLELLFLFLSRFISLGKATIVCVLLFGVSLLIPFLDTQTVYENRGEIWTTAIYAGYEHPIAGWGFGNTEVAFREYNHKLYNRLQGYYVDSSHNFLLDIWIQAGFIGLVCLLLLIFDTAQNLIRNKDRIGLVLFLGLLTVMSFNPVSVVTLVAFWWLLGRRADIY